MAECLFDNSKLRGRIVEKYGTVERFSKAVKKNRSSVSYILNNKAKLDRRDIMLFCSALDIKGKDIVDYFFVLKDVKT